MLNMITLINNSAILMIIKITAAVKLYLQVISAVQGGEEPSLKLAADHWQVVDIMISINISFMKIFNIIITMIVVSIKISMFMKILNIMMITMKQPRTCFCNTSACSQLLSLASSSPFFFLLLVKDSIMIFLTLFVAKKQKEEL